MLAQCDKAMLGDNITFEKFDEFRDPLKGALRGPKGLKGVLKG